VVFRQAILEITLSQATRGRLALLELGCWYLTMNSFSHSTAGSYVVSWMWHCSGSTIANLGVSCQAASHRS